MFETERYLKLDPWTGLITMISDRTYQSLEPTHCKLHRLTRLGQLATEVVVHSHRSTSPVNLLPPLPKELIYTYNRLDPEAFFDTQANPYVIDTLTVPTTTDQILAEITKRSGIVFNVDDFIGQPVDQYGSFTLTSLPQSLRWSGSLTITLAPAASPELSDVLTIKSSGDIFRRLSESPDRVMDFIYNAGHDYTTYRYALEAMIDSPNGLKPERLVQILKDVTGDPWVCVDPPSQYNCCVDVIDGLPVYRIDYAGPPILRYTPRTDKRRLIVLSLDESRCSGLSGRLLLHYD